MITLPVPAWVDIMIWSMLGFLGFILIMVVLGQIIKFAMRKDKSVSSNKVANFFMAFTPMSGLVSLAVVAVSFTGLPLITAIYTAPMQKNAVEEAYSIEITKGWPSDTNAEGQSPFLVLYDLDGESFEGKVEVSDDKATVYSLTTGEPLVLSGYAARKSLSTVS